MSSWARTDDAGGPGSPGAAEVWSEMQGVVASEDLARFESVDPFSARYGELQLELWTQWSGLDYDPATTELTGFDMESHIASRTAYGPGVGPLVLSHHVMAVARAVSALGLDGVRALEVGAGWGLQAELLSTLGFEVDVVDVNPAFLDLIAVPQRGARFRWTTDRRDLHRLQRSGERVRPRLLL